MSGGTFFIIDATPIFLVLLAVNMTFRFALQAGQMEQS